VGDAHLSRRGPHQLTSDVISRAELEEWQDRYRKLAGFAPMLSGAQATA
jgi:hypothetical protein